MTKTLERLSHSLSTMLFKEDPSSSDTKLLKRIAKKRNYELGQRALRQDMILVGKDLKAACAKLAETCDQQ